MCGKYNKNIIKEAEKTSMINVKVLKTKASTAK